VKRFVETVAAMGPEADGGLAEALEAAEAMLAEGAAADAAETFAAILGEEPENATAYAGLVRSHLAIGDIDQAEAIAEAAPPAVAKSKDMDAARAQIALARQAAEAGPLTELRVALARDPQNPQLMFDTALALQANDRLDEAVDLLLDLVKLDQGWNDGAAKAQLFTLFGALKPQDPLVLKGRRRLSSILFA
jgi:putative thioredoxin